MHQLQKLTFLLFISIGTFSPYKAQSIDKTDYVELSAEFLKKNMEGKEVKAEVSKIKNIPADSLHKYLKNPSAKKAFWINIYNAFILYQLKNDPTLYEDRSEFFSNSSFTVAGRKLSFDDVEHGILRRSTWKYSLGYIKNPVAPDFEAKFRLGEVDERIHFALNCGAKSCPPVAIYNAENYEKKVNTVARNFLKRVSTYNKVENKVHTTSIFSWFRGDFGGTNGIRSTLIRYEVLPKESDATIEFEEYDWTLDLNNYYE